MDVELTVPVFVSINGALSDQTLEHTDVLFSNLPEPAIISTMDSHFVASGGAEVLAVA